MSKQVGNVIEIALSAEETTQKVMSAMTDPARRYRTDAGHPEVCNIYRLHRHFSPEQLDIITRQCRSAEIGCVQCKKNLAQAINTALAPFRERRAELEAKPEYVSDILADGARRAHVIARRTIREVRQKMRLV
jgi:tryptophanyl-tRNA synthetase